MNRLDIELYEYAVTLFEERMRVIRREREEEQRTFPPVKRVEKESMEEERAEEDDKYEDDRNGGYLEGNK